MSCWVATPAAGQIIYFNSPTENAADGTVRQTGQIVRLDTASRAATVIETGLHYPSGIAFDPGGDLFFGNVTFNPLAVQLLEQPPGGAVRNLGTVFSTNATQYASIGGWGFDLVAHDDALYFNSPQLTTMGGALVRSGSIQGFDPATGAQSTVVAGLHNSGGIAFDSGGNLYVGDITSNPFKAQILKLARVLSDFTHSI